MLKLSAASVAAVAGPVYLIALCSVGLIWLRLCLSNFFCSFALPRMIGNLFSLRNFVNSLPAPDRTLTWVVLHAKAPLRFGRQALPRSLSRSRNFLAETTTSFVIIGEVWV